MIVCCAEEGDGSVWYVFVLVGVVVVVERGLFAQLSAWVHVLWTLLGVKCCEFALGDGCL